MLLSDSLKSQITTRLTAMGRPAESLRSEECKDEVFQNLVSQLCKSVVNEMVMQHRTAPPTVLSVGDKYKRL